MSNAENEQETKIPTRMSKLVKFLIKVWLIPVRYEKKTSQVTFKLCSKETAFFSAICLVIFLLNQLTYMLSPDLKAAMNEYFAKHNEIDTASLIASMVFSALFLSFPLFLGHALPFVPKITMARDLNWPKHGVKYIFGFCLIFGGQWGVSLGFS